LKKQYIVGAVFVIVLLCALIEIIPTVVENGPYLPTDFSKTFDIIIGICMSFYAFSAIVLGVWWTIKPSTKFMEWNKRFTLTASVPGYFLLALLPLLAGLILIVLTHETTWGFTLSCLSFPAILIFLALAIWKDRKS
jgi:hypothetical protein